MNARRRFDQVDSHLPLLIAVVISAMVVYIPIDPGSLAADLRELAVPLAAVFGLLLSGVYLHRRRLRPEQRARIAGYGWTGALVAGGLSGWWILLSLARELPIGHLTGRIVTAWSLGIGIGVLAGILAIRRHDFGRVTDRERVLAETTWIGRSGPDPILQTAAAALAEVEGVDPTDLEPLFGSVDPDVFEKLRTQDGSEWQLRFETDGYEVRISSHGTLTVYDVDSPARPE